MHVRSDRLNCDNTPQTPDSRVHVVMHFWESKEVEQSWFGERSHQCETSPFTLYLICAIISERLRLAPAARQWSLRALINSSFTHMETLPVITLTHINLSILEATVQQCCVFVRFIKMELQTDVDPGTQPSAPPSTPSIVMLKVPSVGWWGIRPRPRTTPQKRLSTWQKL